VLVYAAVIPLLVICVGLIVASASKVTQPADARGTLVALGFSEVNSRVFVSVAIACELAVASALVVSPHALLPRLACETLFVGFAVLGVRGLLTGRSLECGCFGALRDARLGWRQVILLALVSGYLAVAEKVLPTWTTGTGVTLLFFLDLGVAALFLVAALPLWLRVRSARISLGSVGRYVAEVGWPEFADAEMEGLPR
jgi:hypothetical protein